MKITSDDSRHDLLGPIDDDFHAPDDHYWFHETAWWSFYVPERKLAAWIYNWVRPNVGTSGGGCWLWDDSTRLHWELPYYACYNNLAIPAERDLREFTYPSGVSTTTIEPLTKYQLGFRDRDIIAFDLEFDATMPPWVGEPVGDPPVARHLDQLGRVTGEVVLRGERIQVDSIAMRDRSWSPRSERWKDGHVGYCSAATEDVAFLATSAAGVREETDERVRSGFFVRDGQRARIVDGTRDVVRDPEHGHLRSIRIEAEDTAGRRFVATGTGLNAVAAPIPGVHAIVWICLVDWSIDGVQAWGDDQDAWPIHEWAAFRRRSRGG
ncbi:MAG: hypothetical protein AB7Q42_13195 [Acidimicrobiia bacterium]